jgi:hypothetical protein
MSSIAQHRCQRKLTGEHAALNVTFTRAGCPVPRTFRRNVGRTCPSDRFVGQSVRVNETRAVRRTVRPHKHHITRVEPCRRI